MNNQSSASHAGRNLIAFLVVAMIVLHHDFWFWDDRRLVLGFMPIGLLYHTMYSLAAGALWLLASKIAWPVHIEQWADECDAPAASPAPTPATQSAKQENRK